MDAVQEGETYRITCNGVEVAELGPLPRRRRMTAEELMRRHRRLPSIGSASLRQEADEFFGSEERVSDSDPWKRPPG
ncbi:PhdYeFM domain-containing protein [Actinokineospora spheciospongiae]|uniref:PhdYeFM domain-containing protein n=1 Tax=Actinokineospora spheciospongiae TaxID=909613 RepID=UPI001F18DB5B|nr:PhdYeFM domain-containing protein [Actinokineospora spheciospongiae]